MYRRIMFSTGPGSPGTFQGMLAFQQRHACTPGHKSDMARPVAQRAAAHARRCMLCVRDSCSCRGAQARREAVCALSQCNAHKRSRDGEQPCAVDRCSEIMLRSPIKQHQGQLQHAERRCNSINKQQRSSTKIETAEVRTSDRCCRMTRALFARTLSGIMSRMSCITAARSSRS